jgi:hypothetical protein
MHGGTETRSLSSCGRGTEERTLTLPVRNRLRTVETVAFDRNASPKALRIRSGILKGS